MKLIGSIETENEVKNIFNQLIGLVFCLSNFEDEIILRGEECNVPYFYGVVINLL